MLKKNYTKTKQFCRVTFRFDEAAENVKVIGEFNDWGKGTHEMKKRKDGTFSLTISMKSGNDYRFRYLVDGEKWHNDIDSDEFVRNKFGTQDALIHI